MKISSAALAIVTLVALAPVARAATPSIAGLAGPWAATIEGMTGCGFTSKYTTFTLDSTGQGSAHTTTHSSTCGDGTDTNPIVIETLSSNGVGTAHLSCGTGCGWDLNIQVLAGNKLFSLVDVSNPDNYLLGTAIKK